MSPKAESILNTLKSFGVGKVTGGGGSEKGSGFLLFYADQPEKLIKYLIKKSIHYYPFTQDYKGVQQV